MLSLITGVSAKGQVGEAVAGALARRGDRVVLVARSEERVQDRVNELIAAGFPAHGYACDLADADAVRKLAQRVSNECGDRLDCLVNLAGGFGGSGPLAESNQDEFQRMLRINLITAYQTTRAFLPMIRAARGSIVYFASEAVLEGSRTKGISAYAAAKAGVVALMKSVADEGREYGVKANALAPGSIRTTTNEMGMGSDAAYVELEDVASSVVFLCSPSSGAISGQVIRLKSRMP